MEEQKDALWLSPRSVASYSVEWGLKHREVICFSSHTRQVGSKGVKARTG